GGARSGAAGPPQAAAAAARDRRAPHERCRVTRSNCSGRGPPSLHLSMIFSETGFHFSGSCSLCRLEAEPLRDGGELGALLLDCGGEFRRGSGTDDLAGGGEALRDRWLADNGLDVGSNAVAHGGRHVLG